MTIKDIEKFVKVSKCGKYVYPVDSVTGAATFAPVDYFIKKVETKFGGNIEKFIKEYVTRETKKYLKEGWTPDQLKEIVKERGKLPKLDKKPKKDPNAPKKERRKRVAAHAKSTVTIINSDGETEVVRVYPWSNDPTNYFRSTPSPVNIAEATKETCLRPEIYLDAECYGCNFFNDCTCKLKNLELNDSKT